MLILDKVDLIEKTNSFIRSEKLKLNFPSVIKLKTYVFIKIKNIPLTRKNIINRDNNTCQYCGKKFSANDLTFDHLVPKCLHGRTTWQNVVSACTTCNLKKGRKLLQNTGMRLLKKPIRPHSMQLQNNGRNFPPNYLHYSWRDYLYWDTELEN